MTFVGNEKIIDDPVMVDGKFVRNVGGCRTANIYEYVYMKDGDKDLLKRMRLAIMVGGGLGASVGIMHVSGFGRNPKFPTKWDPFVRVGFSCLNGMIALALHAGTVSVSSQLQGGRDLVRSWALGGFISGAFIRSVVHKTPQRMQLLGAMPLGLAAVGALTKIAVVYDKPLRAPAVTTYGVQACERSLGPRHIDTMNPYRRQEEHYLEKYL